MIGPIGRPHPGGPSGIAAILLVLLGLAGLTQAVAAQSEDGPPPPLTVIDQTTWVTPGAPFTLVIEDPNDSIDPAGTIRLRLRDAVANRDEFAVGLGDAGPGPVASEIVLPTALAQQPGGRLEITVTTDADGQLPISQPGVYPLDLAVDVEGGETADLLTHLLRLPAEESRPPLRVATIVPVGADPSVRPGGGVRTTRDTVDRIDRRIAPLVEQPDVALTVVPLPETMESLTVTPRGRASVDALGGALAGREVLAAPYIDLDEADWVASGLVEPLGAQATAGAAAVESTLDVLANRATRYLAEPPEGATLPVLQDQGESRLVVPASAIVADAQPADGAPWLAPVLLTTETTQLAAGVTDDDLQSHAGSTGDPVLDAHRTIADLATIALSRPLTPAGVVLALPEQAGPETGYLETILAGLDDGPLQAVTVTEWFDQVGDSPATRGVAPRESGGLEAYRANLGLTHLTLAGFTALTDGADPSLEDLRRQELVSGSMAFRPTQQAAYLTAIGATIRERTRLIDTPADQTVTLTSQSGRIPVSIRNRMGIPARVRLQVSSDRLEFPEGSQIDVELNQEITTVEVPVRARTTGSFQMAVAVTSPDGVLAVTASQITIRSTAVSSVGVVLSIGAGLVLLTWWLRHWREHRRDSRLVDPDTGTSD